jgi:glucokinase
MLPSDAIFIGADGGATTSKIAGVQADGSAVSTTLLQRPTRSEQGPPAVIAGWIESISEYLDTNGLAWSQVRGVGVAIPGPRRSYGVLESSPNLPASFGGWDVQAGLGAALAARAGRPVPLSIGNDGNMGGVAEARRARGERQASVIMLAPGSGLGAAFIDARGLPLDGDTLAGMEGGHMPAPLHLLGAKPHPCGCGRSWGCFEVYTSLAGLPYLLEERLPSFPGHPLADTSRPAKQRALALRGLAQEGDVLANELFDFQARAMGLHVANLAMALDPEFVVIGGGLIDPDATTPAFRERYLETIRETARPYLWPAQRERLQVVPAALGELSQAIGAALVALYEHAR